MLRSTSVKQESWKPVKLLAKQPVKEAIISLETDFKGKVAVALTNSTINIFSDRNLLKKIDIKRGKKIKISSVSELIYVLTSEKLYCLDYWGNLEWEYSTEGLIDDFSFDSSGTRIVLQGVNFLIFLSRFGDLDWEYNFEEAIVSVFKSSNNLLLVSTINAVFSLDAKKQFVKTLELTDQLSTFFSDDGGGISLTKTGLISFSLTGHILWEKQTMDLRSIKFSNSSLKNYTIIGGKKFICHDRNGVEIWNYTSEDIIEDFKVIESGLMAGIYSNSYLHILDRSGEQAWSYYAREEIVDFSFSSFGGDIVLASKNKIHWFQNEGFLRNELSKNIIFIEELISKVSEYEFNLGDIEDNWQLVKEQSAGNFQSLKKSFNVVLNLREELEKFQKRHVNYLDSLSNFMQSLDLEGAQTDEMVPLIYPYYSLYVDILDGSDYSSLIEYTAHLLSKLNRYDLTKIKKEGIFDQKFFISEAKAGIQNEILVIKKLIAESEKDLVSLKSDIKSLILSWLKSGTIDQVIQDFFHDYKDKLFARLVKKEVSMEKIDSHMAFVDYNTENKFIILSSSHFSSQKKVDLRLNIFNNSGFKLNNLSIRAKLEGNGLELSSPPSGVLRLNHIGPNESASINFEFYPNNRANTRVILISEYLDEIGRKCIDWLGECSTNFLGCYVNPLVLSEKEHEDLRLRFNDYTSHSSLNVEGLQVSQITKIIKAIPGLYLCNLKEEENRSIIYQSGESNLDKSEYLSMIFLRRIGEKESLKVAVELICHSTDQDNSSEIKEEIISYIKNVLLNLNAKLV